MAITTTNASRCVITLKLYFWAPHDNFFAVEAAEGVKACSEYKFTVN